MCKILMTKSQKEIMKEFYSFSPTKVIYDKNKRNQLWKAATSRNLTDFAELEERCPALAHQIQKSYENGNNIQSAVFSECVYAQTIANMFGLNIFVNCFDNYDYIPQVVIRFLESYKLVARYVYSTEDKRRMLIQAGGCGGVDSALVTVIDDLIFYTIEFKEQGAKTGEPDLPKYGEDGILRNNENWLTKNPQFKEMLAEQEGLNFFQNMGHNINNFSKQSIALAVSNVGVNKIITVICTEDINGYLVMLPSNQAYLWAKTEGEIRPAGRNKYAVWTPNALRKFIIDKNGTIDVNNKVCISKDKLTLRKERGGDGKISGYKINPLFFVYVGSCKENGNNILFDLSNVWQLNPTIAGKMFFSDLKYADVKKYYFD